MSLSKSSCSQITFYTEWDVQNVKGLLWCFHSQNFLQHFHLSSPFFCLPLLWTFSAWDMRAIGRKFPLFPEWDDHLKYRLTRPISCNLDVNTSYGSCAVCSILPGSLITYGFADPLSSILGLPKFLVFPKSLLLYAVQMYLTFLHQTAAHKNLALFSLE